MNTARWTDLSGLYHLLVSAEVGVGDVGLLIIVVDKHLRVDSEAVVAGGAEDGVDPRIFTHLNRWFGCGLLSRNLCDLFSSGFSGSGRGRCCSCGCSSRCCIEPLLQIHPHQYLCQFTHHLGGGVVTQCTQCCLVGCIEFRDCAVTFRLCQ